MEEMPNPFKNPILKINIGDAARLEGALDDYQYASEFIYSYRGSPDTFATYRREIEHFLHWSWLIAEKSIKSVLRQDIEAYVEFTKSPQRPGLVIETYPGSSTSLGNVCQTSLGGPTSQ